MLRRKALEAMKEWKRLKTSQALLVIGARQVGKTYLIRQFARECYRHFVELNLIEQPDFRDALASAPDAATLFLRITAFAKDDLVPGETLVFIDEAQECPEIVTALKFLVDRYGKDFDFVISGSLLGVELKDIRSMPVGYLSEVEMFPLDFEEFCWAQGVADAVIAEVRAAFERIRSVDEFVHARLLQTLHVYLVVGGMPDAVQAYVESNDLRRVQRIQNDIINLYRRDISKYAGSRACVVRRVFDLVPAELNTQSKRFIASHIEGTPRFDRYDNDFSWLVDAGVALSTQNVAEPRYPLELSTNASYFKLFMSDVGLLARACGMEVVRDLLFSREDVNYGSIYENYVAQELVAHGLCSPSPDRHLYYFRSRKMGELDFLAEWPGGRVLPIEVKSGKTYKRHSALTRVLGVENYGLDHACVLCERNVEHDGKVTYLPIYMTMFMLRES